MERIILISLVLVILISDCATGRDGENSAQLKEWFALMREQSELRRYERELLVRRQEMELEDRHARLQQELRLSLAKDGTKHRYRDLNQTK